VAKRILTLDFDGVLNNYGGWNGEDDLSTPRDGVGAFLASLNEFFDVKIMSSREPAKIQNWLKENDLDQYISEILKKPVPFWLHIDDRALRFDGNYKDIVEEIEEFKPYWED